MISNETTLTFGSLFSGIGGIDLGLERAGMQCRWQIENDEYASKVLAKHWPSTARFGDIRGVTPLERVDLIAGGFPCQDISSAGKRAGITGERSGLWSEFYRLICELRPRYVLVENVEALVHRGLDRVLGDLATSGYDAEWTIISAASVGAPHLRERIFIVAYPASGGQQERKDTERIYYQPHTPGDVSNAVRDGCNRWQLEPLAWQQECSPFAGQNGDRQQMANANRERLAFREVFRGNAGQELSSFARNCITGTGQWATEPRVGRVANGISNRVDRLRTLGNAVVLQVAEFIGRLIMQREAA